MVFKQTTRTTRKDIPSLITSYPSWTHPDVMYAEYEWELLRDTYQGEREIKLRREWYLPHPSGMDEDDYLAYLENATYYNMTARTVGSLVGSIFKRNPVVSGLPTKFDDLVKNITKDNGSLRSFSITVAKEVLHMGRYGVLVDRPAGPGNPYLVGYVAEAILDWKTIVVDGRNVLSEVVLMEIDEIDRTVMARRRFKPMYRVLRLVNGRYEQHIYRTPDTNMSTPDINAEPSQVIVPVNRGEPLDYIPFMFFGPDSNSPNFARSPIIDIARLNLSHYRSYAHLEHGRFYTGLPVYYVSKNNGETAGSYTIGPSVVWEVASGEHAGLLEFNGSGLKFLENACAQKEDQISTLGGRLIGMSKVSTGESDNQVAMKNRNEQALLLNVTLAMDEGLTTVLQWWLMWQDVPKATAVKCSIEFSKEFLLKDAAAREFRAIQAMYDDGILPIQVVYDYLLRADVIPSWMEIDEFTKLLDDRTNFPNNVDVGARQDGYPDRKIELGLDESGKERQNAIDITETQGVNQLKLARQTAQDQAKEADKSRKFQAAQADKARKAAAKQPKPMPGAPNQPPGNGNQQPGNKPPNKGN